MEWNEVLKAMSEDEDDTQPISGTVPRRAVAYRTQDIWIAQILECDLTAEAGRLEDLPAEVEHVLSEAMVEPSEGIKTAPLRFWEMYQGARTRIRPAAAPYSTEIRFYEGSSSPALDTSALGPFRRQDYLRLPDEPRCELLYGWLLRAPNKTLFRGSMN